MSSLAPPTEAARTPPDAEVQAPSAPASGRVRHGAFRASLTVAEWLPLPAAFAIARTLGRTRYRLQRGSLRVDPEAVRALDATPAQVEALACRASQLQVSDELERRLLRRARPGTTSRLLRLEGLDNLETALREGKGAVLYSLHLWGKYTFLSALAESGHPPAVVAHRPQPTRLAWMTALQERWGFRFIWRDGRNFGVAVEAANVLRRNGVLVILLDWPRPPMVEVDFLGRRARLAAGIAAVAQSTDAPLLDFYLYRRGDRWLPQVAELGAPHPASGDTGEVLQRCADRLAVHVRRDPAAWTFFCNHPRSAFVDTTVRHSTG